MKIIFGLGNIGKEYENTRHNCGFIALDEFAKHIEKQEKIRIEWNENKKLKCFLTKFTLKGKTVLLIKPTTFMNLSGESAQKVLNFYKESIKNIVVIYDDIDLPLGSLRIREKGSAGTHNGMKSLIQHLGSQEFKRIRIGIESRGELSPKQQDIASFVLSNFTEKEKKLLENSIKKAIEELLKQLEF